MNRKVIPLPLVFQFSMFILLSSGAILPMIISPVFAIDNTRSVDIVPGAAFLAERAFSPNPLEISAGTTVVWTNQDTETHTVTSEDSAAGTVLFSSTVLSRGMQFNYTFDREGNFTYHCSIHPTMVGTVNVTDAGTTPPATKLTVQTDKPTYHVSETVFITGYAPADQPIRIRILNPGGHSYRLDAVLSSPAGSYSYPLTIDSALAMNGTYKVSVTTVDDTQQQAEAHFVVENYAAQTPTISVDLANTGSPRFGIDTLEISGTLTILCLESTSAPNCPPQTGTIFWGDGTDSTFVANSSSTWGPVQHIFSTAGSMHISVILSENDDKGRILAHDELLVTVMKHKTSLSMPKLSNYTVIGAEAFQGLDIILTDVDLQQPIRGKTITFSGSALAANVSATGLDNRDFVFPVELKASDNIGNMTLYASFAGDNQYEAANSDEIEIFIVAAPAPSITVNSTTPSIPATSTAPAAPTQGCAPGNLQCIDSVILVSIVCLAVAGGAVGAYKIVKKGPTPDRSNANMQPDNQVPRPRMFVRSGTIKGYIALDGEKLELGGL